MDAIDRYCILGHNVGLRSPSQAVSRAFRHLLGGFLLPDSSFSISPYEIAQKPGEDTYHVTKGGILLGQYRTLSDLLSRVEWMVLAAAFEAMPYLGIHAGATTHNGRTMLLPGRSGAGKTSLVLGLLLRGWTLLSDEVAAVRTDTSAVHPFPRVLCVKHRSLDMFAGLDCCGRLSDPDAVLNVGGVSCVAPRRFAEAPQNRSFAVDAIVFPAYEADSETRLDEISRARGLGLLMRHAFNRDAFPEHGLGTLGRLVERARCFELHAGSLRASIDLLLGIFDRTAPCASHP